MRDRQREKARATRIANRRMDVLRRDSSIENSAAKGLRGRCGLERPSLSGRHRPFGGSRSDLESRRLRPVFEWNIGSRVLTLGKRTLVMGVVNVTPDSFSDGGQFLAPEKALAHALLLLDEGADIVDIGGESTRPGAKVAGSANLKKAEPRKTVSEKEELDRVLPVIRHIKHKRPDVVISVDTYKASVARAA